MDLKQERFLFCTWICHLGQDSAGITVVKNLSTDGEDTGDTGSIPGWVTSSEGGHGHPLQYSCLENSIDGGTWRPTVHRVGKSWTQLSTHALIWAGFASWQQQRASHGWYSTLASQALFIRDPLYYPSWTPPWLEKNRLSLLNNWLFLPYINPRPR